MKLVYVKSDPVTLGPGEANTAVAECPSGMVVVSGGGGGDPRLRLWLSRPLGDGSGWQAGAVNEDPELDVNVEAWALCTPDAEFEGP